jgi:hypothetical protein
MSKRFGACSCFTLGYPLARLRRSTHSRVADPFGGVVLICAVPQTGWPTVRPSWRRGWVLDEVWSTAFFPKLTAVSSRKMRAGVLSVALIVVVVCGGGSIAAQTNTSTPSMSLSEATAPIPSCEQASKELREFLNRAPHGCRTSADCDGYFISANSCAPAVVLRRPGVPHEREPELLRLQSRARSACAAQWNKQPACSPIPFRAACVQNRCTDTMHPGPNKPERRGRRP